MFGRVMYRSLIVNTVISAFAYIAISVVGIVVVSWLVKAYGLAAYGLITLARLFLPSGFAGILDLGAPENASHTVATARATNDWETAGAMIMALIVTVILVSLLPCLAVALAAPALAHRFGAGPRDAAAFAHLLQFTAAILPLALAGLVAEGVIRGFERYGMARGIEVIFSLAYGIGCFCYIAWKFSFRDVIALGIIVSTTRAVVALVCGIFLLKQTPITCATWRTIGLQRAWKRARVTAPNKMLGTVQTQSPTMVIGLLLGPAAAAVYDVLTRLPRFAKSALGLVNSAVMPFTSRLEAANRHSDVTRVVETGLVLIAFLTAPPLCAAATFSLPLLKLWLGKALADYWFWQSLAFVTPLITVLLGFGESSLFGRTHVYRRLNMLVLLRIVLQFAIAIIFLPWLAERGFLLGGVLAWMITAVWEFALIFKEHSICRGTMGKLAVIMSIGALLTGCFLPLAGRIHSITMLLAAATGYVWLFWGIGFTFLFRTAGVALLRKALASP